MTIRLESDLEELIRKHASEQHTTPEAIVMDILRERLSLSGGPSLPHQPAKDWKTRLRRLPTHCGVSLSDEAVSSEGLYD
jgi:hypothetical protein